MTDQPSTQEPRKAVSQWVGNRYVTTVAASEPSTQEGALRADLIRAERGVPTADRIAALDGENVEGASPEAENAGRDSVAPGDASGPRQTPSTTQEAEKALEAVRVLEDAARNWKAAYKTCPCGAWFDRLNERGHVLLCPIERFDVALRSLRTQLEQVTRERDEAQRWMRFIADTQHRLLEAFRTELSDEEWADFAEALGIEP